MSELVLGEIGNQGAVKRGNVSKRKNAPSSLTPSPSSSPSPTPRPLKRRIVHPPATAKNRSDLGETIVWFRRHQGGLYYKDDLIHGILLVNDDFGGLGHFDGRVLITRLVRQTNEKRSTIATVARAAQNTLETQAMIGLVISKDFQKLPTTFRDGERFGVSGFWHLTKLFAVKSEGSLESELHTDIMARLVYSGPGDDMWWTSESDGRMKPPTKVLNQGVNFDDNFAKRSCPTCGESSTTVFQEGWACTNLDCPDLSVDQSGKLVQKPAYLEQFLEPWVSQDQVAQPPPPLLPARSDRFQLMDDEADDLRVLRDHWRGWVCSVCRTMNRRKDYNRLVCSCGQSFLSSPPHIRLDQVAGEEFLALNAESGPPHKSIIDSSVQLVQTDFTERFAIYTWELCPDARVIGLYPRAAANESPNGNNKVFEELQEKMRSGAIPMTRAGFVDDTGRRSFTRHFCANFGRQYNASMEISTTPFEEADPLVTDLVGKAKAIVRDRLGVEIDFNEALFLAYLPNMSIGWHNDGEAGLGDIIVSHSFGSNCEMLFAMKGAYWAGRKATSKKDVVLTPDDPHLPGCLRMKERKDLWEKFRSGNLTQEEYEKQLKEVVKENPVARSAVSPTLLRLIIPHGGYIIMSGKSMQKYYQHSAMSTGLMRFVATMRQVGDDHESKTNSSRRRAAREAREAAMKLQQDSAPAPSDPALGKRKRDSA